MDSIARLKNEIFRRCYECRKYLPQLCNIEWTYYFLYEFVLVNQTALISVKFDCTKCRYICESCSKEIPTVSPFCNDQSTVLRFHKPTLPTERDITVCIV